MPPSLLFNVGLAPQNVEAGAALGVRRFDSAVGGCGGCNFVPDAQGNVSTQAVLGVLDTLGIAHSMQSDAVQDAHRYLEAVLERTLASDADYTPSGVFAAAAAAAATARSLKA